MSKFVKLALILLLVATTSQAAVFKVKEGGAPPFFTNLDTALFTASTFGPGPHQIEVYAGTYNTDIDLVVPTNVDAITGVEAGVFFVNPAPPTLIDPTKNFLDVKGSLGLTISGLHVSGYNGGIVTAGPMATDLTVEDCVFEDNIVGIYVGSNGGLFNNIQVINAWLGIGINSLFSGEAIDNNLISNSTFQNIRRAPAISIDKDEDFFVPGAGNLAASLHNNDVVACVILECTDQGILLNGGTGTDITGCEISDVQFGGIVVYGGASGGLIANNTISQTAQGSVNPDSTLLTWAGLGAVSLFDGDGFTIEFNNIFDNGGLGSMGDGSAFADFAVALSAASVGTNRVRDNCFYGHDGKQGSDDGDGTNVWRRNWYSDLAAVPYLVAGTAGETDTDPALFNNSANTGAATYEVLSIIDMTFDWTAPDCDPLDSSVGLASYEFTVTFDPAKLAYVGGSGAYNEDFLGDTAFYGPIDASVPGQVTFAGANFVEPGVGSDELASAQFEAIGTGPVTVTLASTYLDGDNNPIIVENTALNLTIEDTQAPTIDVTANNPVGDDTYSDFVDLEITGNVTDNFDLKVVAYQFDGTTGWSNFATVDGQADTYGAFTVPLGALSEGPHVLNLRVRDESNNEGFVDYSFTIDRTGPALSTVVMSDADGCSLDPEYTNDNTVTVTLTDDGTAVEMQFSQGPGAPEGFIPYANPTAYTLTGSDGAYQLYVQLKDAYGNVGGWVDDFITLDLTPPTVADAWLVSDPTPATTTTATIDADANWGVAGGTVEYALSEDPNDMLCAGTVWTTAPPSPRPISFTLSSGDGLKTVYFGARDIAGNIHFVTETITLDTQAPEFLTMTVPACSQDDVEVSFTWDDGVHPDVELIKVGKVSGTYDQTFNITAEDPSDASVIKPLPPSGSFTIYAVLVDAAGNVGPEVSAGPVEVDPTAPSAGNVVLNGGDGWTNSATVDVLLTGAFDADITEIRMTQTSGDYSLPVNDWQPYVGNPGIQFTFDPPVEGGPINRVYLQVRDCAGNISTEVDDGIRVDLTDPVISLVEINSGDAITNNPVVSVAVTDTEVQPDEILISEAADMTGAVSYPYGGPYSFTLSSGDADKTLYVQLIDKAGNESNIGSDNILLDTQAPTGTLDIVSTNPLAAPGYTNTNAVTIENISHDGDVVLIIVRNDDLSMNTGWVAPVTLIDPWTLGGSGGTRTVEMRLEDVAGNKSPWLQFTIQKSTVVPAPAVNFTATPGGSLMLEWDAGPNDQYYFFRYNASFEYPTYASGPPPAPAATEGFFGATVTGTSYHFDETDYPDPDMFSFSLWTVDNFGNTSTSAATTTGINYIPGDFNWDGTVEFVEFGDIAAAYLTSPNTKPTADISADVAEDPLTVAAPPDGIVSFPDLNKFAQNYSTFGDFGTPKAAAPGPVALTAVYPNALPQGSEYTFSLNVDDASSILAYRVVLDINEANFEVVSVEPGNAYRDNMPAFFHHNSKSTDIEIDGAVFGTRFSGDELAVVTVRARTNSQLDLEQVELIAQGPGNESIDISFEGVAKEGLVPMAFSLHQNYPNPFNPSTVISFDLPVASKYELTVYNVAGQAVKTFSSFADPGTVEVEWNAEDVASGIYFYRIVAGDFTASKKMMLLK